ncbi:hypothetical protein ACH79_39435 [Bradyrhizobium sp. CCBAU 051011]|nr:hypothetical protein ACH79_39435 [Bradyrhizobium sp. CCBAU 051011]
MAETGLVHIMAAMACCRRFSQKKRDSMACGLPLGLEIEEHPQHFCRLACPLARRATASAMVLRLRRGLQLEEAIGVQ